MADGATDSTVDMDGPSVSGPGILSVADSTLTDTSTVSEVSGSKPGTK